MDTFAAAKLASELPPFYSLSYTTADEFDTTRGFELVCQQKLDITDEVHARNPRVEELLAVRMGNHYIFPMVLPKEADLLVSSGVTNLALPKLDCERDRLDWRFARNVIEVTFRGTSAQVPCYFQQTSHCSCGSSCRYSHRVKKCSGMQQSEGSRQYKGTCNAIFWL